MLLTIRLQNKVINTGAHKWFPGGPPMETQLIYNPLTFLGDYSPEPTVATNNLNPAQLW